MRTPTSGRERCGLRLALPKVTNSNSSWCGLYRGWRLPRVYESFVPLSKRPRPSSSPTSFYRYFVPQDILPKIIIPRSQTSIYAFHFQSPIFDSRKKTTPVFDHVRRRVRRKVIAKKILEQRFFAFSYCISLFNFQSEIFDPIPIPVIYP